MCGIPVAAWWLLPLNLLLGNCCSLCINTGLGPSVGAWYLTGCIKQSSSPPLLSPLCHSGMARCVFWTSGPCFTSPDDTRPNTRVVAHGRRKVLTNTVRFKKQWQFLIILGNAIRSLTPSFFSIDTRPNTRVVAHDRRRSKETDRVPGMETVAYWNCEHFWRKSEKKSTIEVQINRSVLQQFAL